MASSSSSFTYKWTNDVFLSFRGEDTRFNFTGNLYNSLHKRGIKTFIDDKGLRRGQEITPALLKTIDDSRIAIIVFSENYASSTFCLDELVKILELLKEEGRLVWPVFYGVDPSEVRHQRGTYGEAMSEHQRRFENDMEKVQKWKLALQEAANLSGWHFKQGLEYEYQFIERIVKEVSTRINRSPLYIANYPVGLEPRVLKVNSLLRVGSDDTVDMVGIYGAGGIGKSTIARAVYNSIADQFEGICFLDDVRKKSLVQLQETLLSDLVGKKHIKFTNVYLGITILKHRLQKKRVLVILDDVDKVEQLQAIAGGCEWFGSGSRIIITTRDKHLLDTHEVGKIYDVEELNDDESLVLFCWNAFKRNKVDPSYSEIMKDIVDYAKGLPLALEIIGSDLFGKTISEWKSALDRYRRIPIGKVGEVLKVSYDGLGEEEQEIFLDIACFFNGGTLKYVKDMVQHARGFDPEYGLGVLEEKSLVKIFNGQYKMHDLIRDMGREIVRQQSLREPGSRSRLWSFEDIEHVLERDTGTDKVEVIIHHSRKDKEQNVQWSGKAFERMKNLKILIIKNVTFSTGPEHLPNSLRVLEWWGYPSSYLPANFCPKKLFILRLVSSCLSSLKTLKGFESLAIMNFEFCQRITQIPNVSCLPNLTEMKFNHCWNLFEIHHSVGHLDKLRTLQVTGCSKLKSFPPINLSNLETLNLSSCSSLQIFPEVLGEMKNITKLYFFDSDMEFPSSIQNLTRLRELQMFKWSTIRLPMTIAMLPELITLRIHGCGFQLSKQGQDKEKASLPSCANTHELILEGCSISDENLRICLSWFTNVKILNLQGSNFTILPACIKEFHFLRELNLKDCKFLREIRGVPPNIRDLLAENCTLLSSQTTTLLLSQELHNTGSKIFRLPGGRIPEWFDHSNMDGFTSFWFRNKFPALAFCVVVGCPYKRRCCDFFRLHVEISACGNEMFRDRDPLFIYSFDIVADHIIVLDLRRFVEEEEAPLEKEWKHVKVSFQQDPFAFSTKRDFPFAKECGVYVFKQISRMEDIRFTNPYADNEGNEIPSPTHTPSEAVAFTISSKTWDAGSYADSQQTQDPATISEQIFGSCDSVNNVKQKDIEQSNQRKLMDTLFRTIFWHKKWEQMMLKQKEIEQSNERKQMEENGTSPLE